MKGKETRLYRAYSSPGARTHVHIEVVHKQFLDEPNCFLFEII